MEEGIKKRKIERGKEKKRSESDKGPIEAGTK